MLDKKVKNYKKMNISRAKAKNFHNFDKNDGKTLSCII